MNTEVQEIIDHAQSYLENCDTQKIQHAFEFARDAHEGQKRYSGEKYITHPIAACKILLKFKPDTDTICACFLHDVPEDTPHTIEEIEQHFGPSVARLVSGMVKLSKVHPTDPDFAVNNLRKMFLAMAEDLRVVLIKFSDRLHNLRTLHYVPKRKHERIARESLDIYAAIAARLGVYGIKNEIEDICFKYLYPESFQNIKEEMEKEEHERHEYIYYVKEKLVHLFKTENIEVTIKSRVKHYYSVYKKMKNKNNIHEIFDIVALRVILDDKIKADGTFDYSHCYSTLGLIHKHWTPIPQRFKDYIALPKSNGYQSLHTTVMGLGGKNFWQPTEIQVRTQSMDFESEFGIAAHWQYKDKASDLIVSDKKKEWVKNLVSLHKDWQNNKEFLENLKIDIFKDRIFILTPRGDVKDLPQGATPIDFAYALHSEVGHKYKGALVNGSIVASDHKLKSGDIVEILTFKDPRPNLYWLSSVVTNCAKKNIKAWFRTQNRDHQIEEGRNIINKHLVRHNIAELSENLTELSVFERKKLTRKERLDILEKVGNGSFNPSLVVKRIIEKNNLLKSVNISIPKPLPQTSTSPHQPKPQTEILIQGQRGFESRIAACCNPGLSNNIIGYITKTSGIAIHRKDCSFIQKKADRSRLIPVAWNIKKKKNRAYKISIICTNKTAVIKDIIDTIDEYENIELRSIETKPQSKDLHEVHIHLELDCVESYNKIFNHIEELRNVKSVERE